MISMSSNAKKLIGNLKQYGTAKRIAVVNALNKGALRVRNTVLVSMKNTPRKVYGPDVAAPAVVLDDSTEPKQPKKKKRGKLLKKGSGKKRSKVMHAPSVPGHPPAIDTGRLVGSITFDQAVTTTVIATAKVATAVEYAVPLEYGRTKNRAKTRRPFMRPAFDKNLARIRAEVQEAMRGTGTI